MFFFFPELWKEVRVKRSARFVRLVNGQDYYEKQGNHLSKWQQVERVFGPIWRTVRSPYWEYSSHYERA